MSRYTGYTEQRKDSTIKYIKKKQKQVTVRWRKEEFEDEIVPYIAEAGIPIATFIKEAVREKIEKNKQKKSKKH